MNHLYSLAALFFFFLSSCAESPGLEGLWVVTSVKVGADEMTPNARWTRFNADHTQVSGNGGFQHSYGTWELDAATNALSVVNTNGLVDNSEPFVVTLSANNMVWTRVEDGQNIEVRLVRADQLPQTYGDKLLGLWQLEEAVGTGNYFGPAEGGILFFRWDGRFEIQSAQGKVYGVYNVHGHKPEVELIPYGGELNRDFWKIDFRENAISLQLLNTDSTVTRSFTRIHEFPN